MIQDSINMIMLFCITANILIYTITQNPTSKATGHTSYRIANLYFESMEAMKKAFASEIGQQCAADRKILAPRSEDVQIYLYDTQQV